jgi:hypothetical protein
MQDLSFIVGVYLKTSSEEYCPSTCLPTYANIVGEGGEEGSWGGGGLREAGRQVIFFL